MGQEINYVVEITPEAEGFFKELHEYLHKTHSEKSANNKSAEIIDLALSLDKNPNRGSKEESLSYLKKEHQYLVYFVTRRKTVKIIYFVDEVKKVVYISDFFPTMMDSDKIKNRS